MFGRVLLKAIRFYQRGISPMTPASCRFTPTCSEYAARAIREHGAARGVWLAARRISRCHPFGGHGYDPVPGLRLGGGDDPVPGGGLGVGVEGEVENR